MNRRHWTAGLAVIAVAACGSPETPSAPANDTAAAVDNAVSDVLGNVGAAVTSATASLRTADGGPAGTATATTAGDTVNIALQVQGLPAGQHGVHVHATGQCEAPTFESAGGHWNPADKQHGLENPQGQHAGDMPNLTVGEDGSGSLTYALEAATMEGLLDADGSAFVVHAGRDDQTTDPSGNSGDRIACGVFSAS